MHLASVMQVPTAAIHLQICLAALSFCNLVLSVYDAAMPNTSGALVLDDTRSLRGVHIGSIHHLNSTHAPIEVWENCSVWHDGELGSESGLSTTFTLRA